MILNPLPTERNAPGFGSMAPLEVGEPAAPPLHAVVVLATALAYAMLGALALALNGSSAFSSALNPCAGLALATTLTYGRFALLGVAQGALMVQVGYAVLTDTRPEPLADLLPLAGALALTLQAGVGAALLRRCLPLAQPDGRPRPLMLTRRTELWQTSLWGAFVPCALGAGLVSLSLWTLGPSSLPAAAAQGLSWWIGNTLAVVIATPIALAFLAGSIPHWQARRRSLALPLTAGLLMMAAVLSLLKREHETQRHAAFEQQAAAFASEVTGRLEHTLHALQAVHGALRALPADRGANSETLWQATQWWWTQALGLKSVALAGALTLPDAAQGDRADEAATGDTAQAPVVLRYRVPANPTSAAVLSPPSALTFASASSTALNRLEEGASSRVQATLQRARRQGDVHLLPEPLPALDGGSGSEWTLVQALYRGAAANDAVRQILFSGYLLLTLDLQQSFARLENTTGASLQWCLFDETDSRTGDPTHKHEGTHAVAQRLAGSKGCGSQPDTPTSAAETEALWQQSLQWAERSLRLQVRPTDPAVAGSSSQLARLEVLGGLSLAALCALLLMLTREAQATSDFTKPEPTIGVRTSVDEPEVPSASEAVPNLRAEPMPDTEANAPVAALLADAPNASRTENPALPTVLRVRCVDDHPHHINFVRAALQDRGQAELSVSSLGLDGLTAIRQRAPDLLLVNHQLPDISGLELLRHLKSDPKLAGIPAIVLSTDGPPELGAWAADLGALHFEFRNQSVAGTPGAGAEPDPRRWQALVTQSVTRPRPLEPARAAETA